MKRPRVLVVRSGARPFPAPGSAREVEMVERVSHTIHPLSPDGAAFGGPADYVVFTSVTTVDRVFADDALAGPVRKAMSGAVTVAVGEATEGGLREHGIEPGLVAAGSREAILAALPQRLDGRRILLPCGEDGGAELSEDLALRGARVSRVAVYRKVPADPDADLADEIADRPFAAFCVTSPAAARWLFDGVAEAAVARLCDTSAVVLGPSTLHELESRGVERICVARQARFDAAAELLAELASPGTGK
jgi:uroporphyrinogen-III synthase